MEDTKETEEIIERVAALDVGKSEVVACIRVPSPGGHPRLLLLVMRAGIDVQAALARHWTGERFRALTG